MTPRWVDDDPTRAFTPDRSRSARSRSTSRARSQSALEAAVEARNSQVRDAGRVRDADRFEALRRNPAFWVCLAGDVDAIIRSDVSIPVEAMAALLRLREGARGLLAVARQGQADAAMTGQVAS